MKDELIHNRLVFLLPEEKVPNASLRKLLRGVVLDVKAIILVGCGLSEVLALFAADPKLRVLHRVVHVVLVDLEVSS